MNKQKILSIGIRATDNVGDIAITDMIATLCLNSDFQIEKMDFNFRTVIFETFRSYSLLRQRLCGFFIKRQPCSFIIKNRYLRLILNMIKFGIYLPIVFSAFCWKSQGCSKVFIGGGNLLMGIEHGFPLQALVYVMFSRLLGKRVYFVCVGAGPFTAPGVKGILRLTLRLSHRVICRDTISGKLIHDELGSSLVDIEVMPDPVLFWPKVRKDVSQKYDVLFTLMPLFSPEVFPDSSIEKAESFHDSMADLISSLVRQGLEIGILITDVGVDLSMSESVAGRVCRDTGYIINIKVPRTPDEMAKIAASSRIVFSTRMHGAIMAFSQAVPALCIEWQPKVSGLYKDMQFEDLLVKLDRTGGFSIPLALRTIAEIQRDRERYVTGIRHNLNDLHLKFSTVWSEL